MRGRPVGLPDALMCRGSYVFRPELPFIAGQEVCGVVEAVGDAVDLTLGERLMAVTSFFDGHGGFADVALAPADSAFRVPEAMTDVDAASFRIGSSTAWTVRRGVLQPRSCSEPREARAWLRSNSDGRWALVSSRSWPALPSAICARAWAPMS